MNANEIWSIAGAIIASVGGAGIIICAVAGFISMRLANQIDSKIKNGLDKELEEYKAKIEQCRYTTKAQFDREFELYHQLSEAFFSMIVKLSSFTNRDYSTEIVSKAHAEISINEIVNMINKTSDAQNKLYANAAFIPLDIFKLYDEIMNNAQTLFWRYQERAEQCMIKKQEIKDIIEEEDKQLMDVIDSQYKELNNKLRVYLDTLSIIE